MWFASLQLEVWAKEREASGLKASFNTLVSELERLKKLCAERKEAEDQLKKKWKKIEEFDFRRSELETIYSALLKANMVRCPPFHALSWQLYCSSINIVSGWLHISSFIVLNSSSVLFMHDFLHCFLSC